MKRLYAIVGHPVARSLSPAIHNAAFAAAGLPDTYVPLDVRPEGLAEGVTLLRTLGVSGANVTVPHKVAIVPYLTSLHGDAAEVGAVNTLVGDGDGYAGHLTDGEGFLAALAEADVAVETALVLGAGGAARAVAHALARSGVAVKVAARRKEQVAGVVALHDRITAARWDAPPQAALVVNATPLRAGLPPLRLTRRTVAVDLIYGEDTELLTRAKDAGAVALDGSGMLLHQAALSWTMWTRLPAPLDAMRAALAGATGRA